MKARIVTNRERPIGRIDPLIYGQFMARRRWVADEGLHDPGHPEARPDGLRQDVLDAIVETSPTVVRWPGGCTATSYDWTDGVGPVRPRVIDAHFGYAVGNGFGTAEFVRFCRQIGAEPHLNLTTGTGNLREALAWLEYANLDTGTKWAALRREHGHAEPFAVKYWQIGNEEWGPWEIGHTSAAHNAERAREWAKALKKLDPSIKVLALGGGHPQDILDWTTAVVEEAGEYIDYVTQHRYWDFNSATGEDNYDEIVSAGFIEEHLIKAVAGIIDIVAYRRGLTRGPRIAYTEWNCADVAHRAMSPEWRPTTTQYRLIDALGCAAFINAMQRQCNHVTLANFAQTLNVVGMLVVTPEAVLRETVFWALAMQRHHSGDIAVDAWTDCDVYTADTGRGSALTVPYLDVSATLDEASGRQFVSIVNTHRSHAIEAAIDAGSGRGTKTYTLSHEDPFARNTPDAPDAVRPVEGTPDCRDGSVSLSLPPHSYTIVEIIP
ncbi:alpha-L-arabinofuranosidase C-terminal domain-containing protein [Devosia nitrariae]|uniref:non-reducing end alpha-L-arabinofuranosidase n=1 Tax=Devosia nitrariae TaxID=2071872 RepID=A0ABQ5W7A1_9HYPH|nr:alpha-L-arabinofuranosidase C-terminal domain-containing protein [Devosia nitrariae]GLQ55851.1 alpha-N-arabinofuranosidase [Devosia nitrariae]